MADLENRVDRLEGRVSTLEITVERLSQKVDDFIGEMRDFKTEMRRQNEMRAAEISELRQKQDADMKEIRSTFEKMNEKFDKMNEKIDGMNKHVSNLTITAMVGIGAMSVAVVGFTISLAFR